MTNLPPSIPNLRGAVDLSSLVRPTSPPQAAGSPAPGAPTGAPTAPDSEAPASIPVPSLVLEITDATLPAILELSRTVPVIVELYGAQPTANLPSIVTSYGGRLVLGRVNASANPQLQQAFQAQVVPTVAAVVAGRPLALFEGELPDAEVRDVFEQVVAFAAQNGVTGRADVADAGDTAAAEPVEEPLPPHHQDAYDAIDRGDYPAAMAAYKTAIAQDPRDRLAVAGLAQVSLLHRLAGVMLDEVRSAAAAAPTDVNAQLAVADLDVSGGHLEDAFDRLLTLFPTLPQEDRNVVRTRMLDYFEIAGVEDPRVAVARRRLTALLY